MVFKLYKSRSISSQGLLLSLTTELRNIENTFRSMITNSGRYIRSTLLADVPTATPENIYTAAPVAGTNTTAVVASARWCALQHLVMVSGYVNFNTSATTGTFTIAIPTGDVFISAIDAHGTGTGASGCVLVIDGVPAQGRAQVRYVNAVIGINRCAYQFSYLTRGVM